MYGRPQQEYKLLFQVSAQCQDKIPQSMTCIGEVKEGNWDPLITSSVTCQ